MATQTAERATTRNTIQRALVLEAVRSLHNHPTSADVYEVVRVEVPNGADRYDFLNRPHYHAKCRVCGGVFDVDMPYQSDILAKVSDAHGFAIEEHEIIFNGVCSECRKAEGR